MYITAGDSFTCSRVTVRNSEHRDGVLTRESRLCKQRGSQWFFYYMLMKEIKSLGVSHKTKSIIGSSL